MSHHISFHDTFDRAKEIAFEPIILHIKAV